jgi:hypothetical protein
MPTSNRDPAPRVFLTQPTFSKKSTWRLDRWITGPRKAVGMLDRGANQPRQPVQPRVWKCIQSRKFAPSFSDTCAHLPTSAHIKVPTRLSRGPASSPSPGGQRGNGVRSGGRGHVLPLCLRLGAGGGGWPPVGLRTRPGATSCDGRGPVEWPVLPSRSQDMTRPTDRGGRVGQWGLEHGAVSSYGYLSHWKRFRLNGYSKSGTGAWSRAHGRVRGPGLVGVARHGLR